MDRYVELELAKGRTCGATLVFDLGPEAGDMIRSPTTPRDPAPEDLRPQEEDRVMDATAPKKRIVILGGGFGGVSTARHLERLLRRRPDVEIVLVSRDNFVLMTPLLFEVFSGSLDLRGCSLPVRAFLRSTRFVEAAVEGIDLDRRVVRLACAGEVSELAYDQLVLALGSKTNRDMIPGSEHAFTFKTLADALLLRNHVIERFERADVETDPRRKAQLLTFVVVGGGLVGVELLGELTAFVDGIAPLYKHVDRGEVRFLLLQHGDRLMPEIDPRLADYGARVLAGRRGVELRTRTAGAGHRAGQGPPAGRDGRRRHDRPGGGGGPQPGGRRPAGGEGQARAHRGRGDDAVPRAARRCGRWATAPRSRGRTASRTPAWPSTPCAARVLAGNIAAVLDGRPPRPFVYHTLGMMGSLGHGKGFGQLLGVRVYGFPAWFIRRTYYLLQMPGWSRKLRIVIDWTFALLFRPDIVKVGLDSETALLLREVAGGDEALAHPEEGLARRAATGGRPPQPRAVL